MDADAYLDRLDLHRPAAADAAALRALQERHLDVVPFESLSIHLGEPLELTEDALFDKIVRRRRGGFCYELNGLFAALLRELGFDATLHAAQMYSDDGVLGPPLDHVAIRVMLEEPWLVDVGSGRFSRSPLRLSAVDAQPDGDGEFLMLDGPHGDVDVLRDGEPQYRLESRPRQLSDFVPMAWWQATSPTSHFTRQSMCTLPTPGGRITLAGGQTVRNGERGAPRVRTEGRRGSPGRLPQALRDLTRPGAVPRT